MLLVIVARARPSAYGLRARLPALPGCQPGDPFPTKGYHSYVEFSNGSGLLDHRLTLVAALASLSYPACRAA